jgi:hypothetical protein
MSISAEALYYFLEVAQGNSPDVDDLSKIISMLENDEEIISYLILKKNVFSSCPELEHMLLGIAKENIIVPPRMRAEQHDILSSQALHSEIIQKLASVMDAEKTKSLLAEDFILARGKLSVYESGGLGSDSLAHRIQLPGREI